MSLLNVCLLHIMQLHISISHLNVILRFSASQLNLLLSLMLSTFNLYELNFLILEILEKNIQSKNRLHRPEDALSWPLCLVFVTFLNVFKAKPRLSHSFTILFDMFLKMHAGILVHEGQQMWRSWFGLISHPNQTFDNLPLHQTTKRALTFNTTPTHDLDLVNQSINVYLVTFFRLCQKPEAETELTFRSVFRLLAALVLMCFE